MAQSVFRSRCIPIATLVAVLQSGCATSSPKSVATFDPAVPVEDSATLSNVQAIALQSTGNDGQTSWIIEPDAPRIPNVATLDEKLPPHIERRLSYAFDLAQRGAVFTAGAEFRSVLGLFALELDARDGGTAHRSALREGFLALDEADDFSGKEVDWRNSADVRHLAGGHITPLLRDKETPVDAISAVQSYYAFAETRLAFACQEMPGSSLAFYGLGRTVTDQGADVPHATGKGTVLQRVALRIAPDNVLAGNELGVLLARHGHLNEAEHVFKQCIARDARPEAWRNLSIVYARNGNQSASLAAMEQSESLASKNRQIAQASYPGLGGDGSVTADRTDAKPKSRFASGLNFTPKLPEIFRR